MARGAVRGSSTAPARGGNDDNLILIWTLFERADIINDDPEAGILAERAVSRANGQPARHPHGDERCERALRCGTVTPHPNLLHDN